MMISLSQMVTYGCNGETIDSTYDGLRVTLVRMKKAFRCRLVMYPTALLPYVCSMFLHAALLCL